MSIQPISEHYRKLANDILRREWGAPPIISRNRVINTTNLPGFVHLTDGKISGLVTYHLADGDCEIITLNSFRENAGIGAALIEAVLAVAKEQNCGRLWLLTSNDNIRAIRYYQKRGFEWVALHVEAISESRKIKPDIPLTGQDGIPIKHELEFEIRLR